MRGKADLDPKVVPGLYLVLIAAWAHGGRKNAHCNWLFFVLVAAISTYTVLFTASDDAAADCPLGTTLTSLIFGASDTILLRNRQPELRKIGQKKPTSEMSFFERLKWSVTFASSPRGLGWTHEATSHIPPKPKADCSRGRFIASQSAWLVFYILLADVASILIRANPCFSKGGPLFSEYGWTWRVTVWPHMFFVNATMSMMYIGASIVTVALGMYRPYDWPHLFGTPRDAYTVRKCWGRVWHQMMRKMLTSHGNFAASTLGLPKCRFTTYFKLYISFLVSGFIHAGGDYILHQNWSTGQSIKFFLLQAIAITCEDAVIGIAKRLGCTTATSLSRLIGYCWVLMWFAFSVSLWLEPNFHAGVASSAIHTISPIMGLWKGDWTPTH